MRERERERESESERVRERERERERERVDRETLASRLYRGSQIPLTRKYKLPSS